MARLKKPENNLSQEDEAKMRGTLHHHQSLGTGYLQTTTPKNMANSQCFHATLLRPYKENSVQGGNFAEPPPELVEGEEVYEVETILNHRKRGQGYQYFVKWQGYPISDASWEPEHVFSDDGNILTQYKLRHSL